MIKEEGITSISIHDRTSFTTIPSSIHQVDILEEDMKKKLSRLDRRYRCRSWKSGGRKRKR